MKDFKGDTRKERNKKLSIHMEKIPLGERTKMKGRFLSPG